MLFFLLSTLRFFYFLYVFLFFYSDNILVVRVCNRNQKHLLPDNKNGPLLRGGAVVICFQIILT